MWTNSPPPQGRGLDFPPVGSLKPGQAWRRETPVCRRRPPPYSRADIEASTRRPQHGPLRAGLEPPSGPTRTRRAAAVQLQLRQAWKEPLNHLHEADGLGRVPTPRRLDHGSWLRARRRRRNLATNADEKMLVPVPSPVAEAVAVLAPDQIGHVAEAAQAKQIEPD